MVASAALSIKTRLLSSIGEEFKSRQGFVFDVSGALHIAMAGELLWI